MQLNLVKDFGIFTRNQSHINRCDYILNGYMSLVVFGADKRIGDKTERDVLNNY
jgi:hypothetical protein